MTKLDELRKLLEDGPKFVEGGVLMSADTARAFGINVDELGAVVPDYCDQCYFCDTTAKSGTSRCDYPDAGRFKVLSNVEPPAECPFRKINEKRKSNG